MSKSDDIETGIKKIFFDLFPGLTDNDFEWKKQQEAKKLAETDSPEVVYERDLGSAEGAKKDEAEKILKTVSSLNEEKTEGLDKLLPSNEDKDKEEDEEDNTTTKKIG